MQDTCTLKVHLVLSYKTASELAQGWKCMEEVLYLLHQNQQKLSQKKKKIKAMILVPQYLVPISRYLVGCLSVYQ